MDDEKLYRELLTDDWVPSADALETLRLNDMSDQHIRESLTFLKSRFLNTHIDEIDGYQSWSELFIVFCIKAADEKEKKKKLN